MKGPLIYYHIQEIYGSDLSSTKLAAELRKDILEQIELGFNVELDFENVRTVTKGWIRNLLGVIVKEQGEDFIKNHILINNMNKNVRKYVLEGIQQMLV